MTGLSFRLVATTTDAKKGVDALNKSLKDVNKTMAGGNTGKATSNLKKFSAAARSAAKALIKMPFKNLASNVKNVATKIGSLGDKFKRILLYRAIRSVIREVTQSFGEGIKNLYGWSEIADGRFAATMDRMSTAFLYFKNSIGAAVAPLLNALAPAIDFVIDKIVGLLNAINQLFAKLTGASYWTKANKVATKYADNASAAGAAAKDALKYLAPFDELNVLPGNNGGGSGGGASGTDYSGMFETREAFSQEIADFAQMVKDAWVNGEWEDVGRFIGGKINELVDRIDWEGAGIKVGKAVNALFGTAYWTLDEINFTNIGTKISEFLNGAISHVNWDIAGRLPVKGLTSIIDVVLGALGGLDWGLIGRSVSDYFKGALDEGINWLKSKDWSQMGTNLFNNLMEFIENVDWAGLADKANTLLKEAIKAVLGLGWGFADALGARLFGTDDWETFKAKAHNFAANIWNSLVDAIKDKAPRLADWLNLEYMDTVEIPVTANLTDAKDNIPPSQKNVTGMYGTLSYWQRGWGASSGYNYLDLPANLTSWSRGWGSGSTYNYISLTASLNGWQRYSGWYSNGWNLLSLTGYLTGWKQAAGVSYQGTIMVRSNAGGGAYYGRSWHDIPQYASGGLPGHGSMFVAGEAGPELVGHIGGRTEVLNASQIASAIAAGVSNVQTYSAQEVNEEVLYNAFLRALNDSDVGGDTYLDGEVIYRSIRKHNDMNTRMTGVNAFA